MELREGGLTPDKIADQVNAEGLKPVWKGVLILVVSVECPSALRRNGGRMMAKKATDRNDGKRVNLYLRRWDVLKIRELSSYVQSRKHPLIHS